MAHLWARPRARAFESGWDHLPDCSDSLLLPDLATPPIPQQPMEGPCPGTGGSRQPLTSPLRPRCEQLQVLTLWEHRAPGIYKYETIAQKGSPRSPAAPQPASEQPGGSRICHPARFSVPP